MDKLYLYLEDGTHLSAESFGHFPSEPIVSEIVFNTSMQGHQEIITDPSYCDQSIVLTYPLIGNYGMNLDDNESISPVLKALIVREVCEVPSNFRSRQTLSQFLAAKKIVGLQKVDTRKLTRLIRSKGTMKSIISADELSQDALTKLFSQELPQNQIEKTSTKTVVHFPRNGGKRVVLVDFGYKKNILESLIKRNCDVIVVPFDTSFEKIQEFNPQGVLLSNGPGDPKSISHVLPTVKKLQDHYPLFGICMGHQIFALANGANTEKMKFGHRGGNHPVLNHETDRVYITAQNHGHCVQENSIKETELEITQINLNDRTIEGLKHKTLPSFSVQYHPEAAPGPGDTKYLFDEFINIMQEEQSCLKI